MVFTDIALIRRKKLAEVSKATRISTMARKRIMASLARAKRDYANIPLGEKKLDPRTIKKRAEDNKTMPALDTTLNRLLYEMRNGK